MAVYLPHEATLNTGKVIVQGGGRHIGFVLHHDGGPQGATALVVRDGFCVAAGCTGAFGHLYGSDGVSHDDQPNQDGQLFGPTGTLPAGAYHLQLIADGTPVRLTIPFGGLGGQVTLVPHGPSGITQVTPIPDRALPSGGQVAYSAGSTRLVGVHGGMHVGAMWLDEPLPKEVNFGDACHFSGPPPAQTRFEFPCMANGTVHLTVFPAGNAAAGTTATPAGPIPNYQAILTFWGTLNPGERSAGAYDNVAGPVTDAHMQQVWIDFQQ